MAKLIEEIEKTNEEEVKMDEEQNVFRLLTDHSEEIGSLLSLLKSASDSGVFTLLQGLFENKGDSMQDLSEELAKPKNVRFVRNLMSIYSLLSNIDPETVRTFMLNLASAVDRSPQFRKDGPIGLMAIRSNMRNPDVAVGFRVLFEIAKGFTSQGKRKE